MAKVRFAAHVVSEMLFGWAEQPVAINNGEYDPLHDEFMFEISGLSVPDTDAEIKAIITQQTNRAGERFHTLRFEER
jgi:hypothetical protein